MIYYRESIDYSYAIRVSEKLGLDNTLVVGGRETDDRLARVPKIFRTIDPVGVGYWSWC